MNQVIALVDDDRNILTSVSIALQAEGFITRVYSDGAAALKAFADNPPDLGVFDIKMPQMDGMELLRRVREMGGPVGAVPVIFLTSKDDELDEALGLAMGADDYIAKPFSQRLLIARIRAILRRQDLERGQASSSGQAMTNAANGTSACATTLSTKPRARTPLQAAARFANAAAALATTKMGALDAMPRRTAVTRSRATPRTRSTLLRTTRTSC